MNDYREQKYLEKIDSKDRNPKLIAFTFAAIALLIQLVGYYLDASFGNTLTGIVYTACTVLAGATLTAAISAFTFEHSGIIEFIRKQAEKVLIDAEYIGQLSDARLKELKGIIEQRIYNPEVAEDRDSLLNYSDEVIAPLITSHFFKSYNLEVNIHKYNEKMVRKLFTRIMVIEPNSREGITKIKLNELLRGSISEKEINGVECIKLNTFKIDTELQNAKIEFSTNDGSPSIYKYKYELVFDDERDNCIEIGPDGCEIEMNFETFVTIDDCIAINKIDVPCKHFVFRVNHKKKEFEVDCIPYIFMQSKNNIVKEKNDDPEWHSKIVESKKWCLPGDGVVVYLRNKE